MKKLLLQNQSFRYIEQSFKEWLDVLGYAPKSVYNMPILIRELFYYLETQGVSQIKSLNTNLIESHYQKLKERTNQRRGGGLSNAHLNKHIQALRKFAEYLRKVGRINIPTPNLHNETATNKITFLSQEEIQLLYQSTYKSSHNKNLSSRLVEAIQSRDRAMLTIFYGCGLRRNEGVHLDVSDINFEKSIIHVRKGKNYKERLVPLSKIGLKYLSDYIYNHRIEFLRGSKTPVRRTGGEALFMGYKTTGRLQGQSLNLRLKYLQYESEDLALQEKEIGLHSLRHSIATHFLAAGMKLESISRFLGHSSLESTQIYTHLFPPSGGNAKGKGGLQAYNNIPNREITQLEED